MNARAPRPLLLAGLLAALVVWLGTGWLFAFQHGYFHEQGCSTTSENATTVLLGPLSYAAFEPSWGLCNVPL